MNDTRTPVKFQPKDETRSVYRPRWMRLWVVASVLGLAGHAAGSTFVVNSTLDTDDKSADGLCRDATNKCTLRAAITEANRDPGADVIHFDISGTGIQTITLGPSQPFVPSITIVHQVTIDATTQAGYAGTPVIELDGAALDSRGTAGIQIDAPGCEVRGLSFKNFWPPALRLSGIAACAIRANHFNGCLTGVSLDHVAGGGPTMIGGPNPADRNVFGFNVSAIRLSEVTSPVEIIGNYIGTNGTGTAVAAPVPMPNPAGPPADGIAAYHASPVIRGNVISGIEGHGVHLDQCPASVIEGNRIGTNATGTAAIPNVTGVRVSGPQTRLVDNTIAGNSAAGIQLTGIACTGTVIQRNKIGVTSDGLTTLVQSRGIEIDAGASASLIGGSAEGEGNVIGGASNAGIAITNTQTAFDLSTQTRDNVIRGNRIGISATGTSLSNQVGVLVSGAARNTIELNTIAHNGTAIAVVGAFARDNAIRRNSIHSNTSFQAIDLDWNGVTPNDTLDVDSGPNNLQNTASVQVGLDGGKTWVGGQLHSSPSGSFELEVFASATCFNAAQYLGTATVTTDANGNGTFLVPVAEVAPSTYITTTVTSQSGSTSELSYCEAAVTCGPVIFHNGPELSVGSVGSFYNDYLYLDFTHVAHEMQVIDGVLPPGLSLDDSGSLTGVPLVAGEFTFTVRATTTRGCTGETTVTLRVCGAIRVAPQTLGPASTATRFTTMLTASGGTPPYTFSTGSLLPLGLDLQPNGLLAGMPREEGTFFVAIDVLDARACWTSWSYELRVGCPLLADLRVEPTTLPAAELGGHFETVLTARGGTPPYRFAPLSLPAGITISPDGMLSGKPRQSGELSIEISVFDASGCQDNLAIPLLVFVSDQPGCDCGAGNPPSVTLVLLTGGLALRRRRRAATCASRRVAA